MPPCRLAAAARAEQGDDAAARNRQRDVGDRLDTARIDLAHGAQLDRRRLAHAVILGPAFHRFATHTRFETNETHETDRLGHRAEKSDDHPDHAHGGRMINPMIRHSDSLTCFREGVYVA